MVAAAIFGAVSLVVIAFALPATAEASTEPGIDTLHAPQASISTSDSTMLQVWSEDTLAEMLAEAEVATIISQNFRVAHIIDAAIQRKAANPANATSRFWRSLDVVFFESEIPQAVNVPFPEQAFRIESALRDLRRITREDRHEVTSLLLREGDAGAWRTYGANIPPPVSGLVLHARGMATRVVLVYPQSDSGKNPLLQTFEDSPENQYSALFADVVRTAIEDHELVVSGAPLGDTFRATDVRLRKSVLKGAPDHAGFVGAVVLVTTQSHDGGVHPVLQLNTKRTSTRELGKASHISGYLNLGDLVGGDGTRPRLPATLPDGVFIRSGEREWKSVFETTRDHSSLLVAGGGPFYYSGLENLYFKLLTTTIEEGASLPGTALLTHWPVAELVRLREHQALTNIAAYLAQTTADETADEAAFRLAQANLRVHGLTIPNFAEGFTNDWTARRCISAELTKRTSTVMSRRTRSDGTPVQVSGLAGFQYREFFSLILPAYVQLGVTGAEEALNSAGEGTVTALRNLYRDEALICALSVEL